VNRALSEIKEGSHVLLYQDARRQWITTASRQRFHTHKGYVDLDRLLGMRYGEIIKTSMGSSLSVFKPRIMDMVQSFDRPTQILYPKDIAYAIYQLGLRPGDTVLEVGTGSGAMTVSIAQAVWPDGHVHTYEMRPEFAEAAKANIAKTGLADVITQHLKDPSEGFDEKNAAAIVVDLGDPWKIAGPASHSLIPGGMLAAFTPTTNQLERLVASLRENGFLVVESVELMIREIRGESGKVRPETRMIGHTAYITIARKMLSETSNE
jgi:tRNA (adenine57-N1/adenine58-N1)-methyltransferase catalytic subunit